MHLRCPLFSDRSWSLKVLGKIFSAVSNAGNVDFELVVFYISVFPVHLLRPLDAIGSLSGARALRETIGPVVKFRLRIDKPFA